MSPSHTVATPTTRPTTEPTTEPRRRPVPRFLRHAVEMVVAMTVGMLLLDPIWAALLDRVGLGSALDRPDLAALLAATDMTIAMTVWMRYRGHGAGRLVEMAAAMFVPYLVLIVPYWLGMLSGEAILMGGHTLMLPAMAMAMAIAMLARRGEYARHHGGADAAHPLIRVLGRRAATWIALAMTVDNWQDPSVPAPWVLLILPAAYLFFGVVRRQLRDPRVLAVQLAGLALYLGLAVIAANAEPTTATLVVAVGWASHAVWDLAHHRADLVAPRWWSEWCGVVDAVIAVGILLLWL